MGRRKITPDNLHGRKLPFGWYRLRFEEMRGGGAGSSGAGAGSRRTWEARRAGLRVRLVFRPGGAVNWRAIVWFHWLDVDPEIAEGQDPSLRIAVSRGQATAEDAILEAHALAVDAFAELGDALGYEVER